MDEQHESFSLPRTAAAVSAALRIPLTDLFAHISLMISRCDPADAQMRTELEAILSDAYRLLRATSTITQTAAYTSQAPTLAPVAIWDELSQCIHSTDILLARSGWHLEYEFPVTDERVNADITSLSTALLHIICNALEASPKDEPVSIKGSVLHDKAVITITDHGCGIPVEEANRLFDLFFSSNQQGLPYQSLGLGLSLAKTVFEQHGGSVQILPKEGGTIVVCSLPLLDSSEELPLSSDRPLYLEDRYSPAYVVLCNFIQPPWPC